MRRNFESRREIYNFIILEFEIIAITKPFNLHPNPKTQKCNVCFETKVK